MQFHVVILILIMLTFVDHILRHTHTHVPKFTWVNMVCQWLRPPDLIL